MAFLLLIYILAALFLSVYGLNALLYSFLFWAGRRRVSPAPPPLEYYPAVTVQLPIYNEFYVVERLVDAAAQLDYPRERLQIQVLDDSNDETALIAQARVDYHRRQGMNIELCRRPDRRGFKAGALAAGLPFADGEYIAIFDADFVPPRSFLLDVIPHLVADPDLGLVQARWEHLNSDYSLLTRAQSIALDGHFAVEQHVRSTHGLFMNFNGTAGVWRRACIEEAGGWNAETLSEDLDLSYRAQLGGWKFIYLGNVGAPAELPPEIHAVKRQQFRWAKGSTQCLIKDGPRLLRAPVSPFKRLQGLIHLTGYVFQAVMLLMLLVLVPLILTRAPFPSFLAYFSLASFGPPLLYIFSQRALYPNWLARFRYFPVLLLLGIGLAFNNSLAVVEAFLGRPSAFRRTPKYNVRARDDNWTKTQYALGLGWESVGEIALFLYALVGALGAWKNGNFWMVPFMILYSLGFGYVAGLSIWHSQKSAQAERAQTRSGAVLPNS